MLAGCNAPTVSTPSVCGDRFCFDSIPSADVRRTSPVEDFVLYDVWYRGLRYRIYEGDNPQRPGAFVRMANVRLPVSRAEIYRNQDVIQLYMSFEQPDRPVPLNGSIRPGYLVILARCPGTQECGIEEFARHLMPRAN